MPQFKPFKGIRPVKEIAGLFATKSVDSFTHEKLKKELESNPDSFLHLVQPTWSHERITIKERQQRVRQNYMNFINSTRSEQDRPSYYIYQLIKPSKEQVRAIIGLVNMHEYKQGKIKKHEKTLKKRVKRFADYLMDVHFHSEPVLLTYPHNQKVDLLMDVEMKRLPVVSFTDKLNNQHLLWQIENRLNLQQIKDSIEKYEVFYIADGHHRMESSLAYTEQMTNENPDESDNAPIHFTLAMLVSDKELIIRDYNRIVKDLNGLNSTEFLKKIGEKFEISERGENSFFPSKKHHFGLYLNGKFYSLFVKKEFLTVAGLSELDTYLFEELILKPILDIQDSRTDNRLKFIRGTGNVEGINHLKTMVDKEKSSAGFFFYPVSSHDLEKIADLGLTMPPKSTYIEPKPLNGLTLFQLKE
ncbi:MAG: DUF1015 domain-containing protein [Weeksellaceae bacterium]|jgi:uncharacterized protein (DUF1015 family)|nr:DUF1015 domain-containing protein [Weeksellaceae bacterium]MDX9704277.1 DUF1015 domain-containing protein [Weeksellaceae bacterium]